MKSTIAILLTALSIHGADFNFKEVAGATSVLQRLEWPIDTNGLPFPNVRIVGHDGVTEVPFQIISNGTYITMLHTPGAYQTNFWTIKTDQPPIVYSGSNYIGGVTNVSATAHWGIGRTNGLTGFRLVNPNYSGNKTNAWLQGWLHRDGSLISGQTGMREFTFNLAQSSPIITATNTIITFMEDGPLLTVVKIRNEFLRSAWSYGSVTIPSAPAYWETTVTFEANQPSFVMYEHSNAEVIMELETRGFLVANQLRMRAHSFSSQGLGSPINGGFYAGSASGVDAIKAITNNIVPDYYSGVDVNGAHYRYGQPWHFTAGVPDYPWIQIAMDSGGANSSPIFGWFSGRAGGTVGAQLSGAGFYSLSGPRQGIRFAMSHRDGGVLITDRHAMHWGLYVGTNGATSDATTPYFPEYLKQACLFGGIPYNKLHRIETTYGDRSQYGNMFLPLPYVTNLAYRVRNNEPGLVSYLKQKDVTPTWWTIVDMWADATGAKTRQAATNTQNLLFSFIDAQANKGGTIQNEYNFLQGGQKFQNQAIVADQILNDPLASVWDRYIAKHACAVFGSLLHDPDFYHLDENGTNRLSLGSANFPIQYRGFRTLYDLWLTNHPYIGTFFLTASNNTVSNISTVFKLPDGAGIDSTHYLETTCVPTILNLMQLQQLGVDHSTNEVIHGFAEFYMRMVYPPDPRFGNRKKLIPIGDGSYEGPAVLGLLPAFLNASNPTLSKRANQLWVECDKPYTFFYAPGGLVHREDLDVLPVALNSRLTRGYASHSRLNWNTTNESAVTLIAGELYHDHRNHDRGMLVIHALGQLISGQFGSFGSPPSQGANLRTLCCKESTFTFWDETHTAASMGIGGMPGDFSTSTNGAFVALGHGTLMEAVMTGTGLTWTQQVQHIDNGINTIIRSKDTFSDLTRMIRAYNIFGTGVVATPNGNFAPPTVINNPPQTTLIGNVPATSLQKYRFGGTPWLAHPNGGVNVAQYIRNPYAITSAVSQWSHVWHPATEQAQYTAANGTSFNESQHRLLHESTNGFDITTVVWRKGTTEPLVYTNGNSIVVSNGWVTVFDDTKYEHNNGTTRRTLGLFTGNTATGTNGLAIVGGPSELDLRLTNSIFTMHGNVGKRTFTLPANWRADPPYLFSVGDPVIFYNGGNQVEISVR